MNIQPNSKNLRKYINKAEYFSLYHEQNNKTFIGENLNRWATQALEQRINELKDLETKGFVYVGEKNWLNSYLEDKKGDSYNTYDKWVIKNFRNYLGIHFKLDTDSSTEDRIIWKSDLFVENYLLNDSQLSNEAYEKLDELEELELFVLGDEQKPSAMHVCALFDALHNLEYSIVTLNSNTHGHPPLSIMGVSAINPINPFRISIEVISDYGAGFDRILVNGEKWRNQ